MQDRRLTQLFVASSILHILALWLASFANSLTPVLCADLHDNKPPARLASGLHQDSNNLPHYSNNDNNNNLNSAHYDPYKQQDLIRVHELVGAGASLRWRGVKSASDLAPQSQVVIVHFDQAAASGTNLHQAQELSPKSDTAAFNRTKQSQVFDTHQEQQQATSGSTSSPSQLIETTTASATSQTPSGWSAQSTTSEAPSATTTCSTASTAISSSGPVGVRIDREGDAVLCGEANANGKSNKRLDRIVGGHKTEPGEFPFQVRLNIRSRRGSGICGGVVLDRWHVLTAAHCMTACVSQHLTTATIESSGVKVTVGDHAIKSDDGELELEAQTITPHERYDACNFYANDHDIALIKTASPIPFKFTTDGYGSVNRPCMPPTSSVQYRHGEKVIVSGWGVTRENSGALSNILRYVQVPIVNVSRCQETYGSRVTNDHVCAGVPEGGKDSCQGDSGGPLVRVVDNRYELVGIVSFGYGCGQAGAAGVYTKVASYLDWIKTNTNDV